MKTHESDRTYDAVAESKFCCLEFHDRLSRCNQSGRRCVVLCMVKCSACSILCRLNI